MKSTRGMESTKKTKAIPHSKRGVFLSKEDQEKTVHRDVTV
jgi:hypothetical protein